LSKFNVVGVLIGIAIVVLSCGALWKLIDLAWSGALIGNWAMVVFGGFLLYLFGFALIFVAVCGVALLILSLFD